MDTNVRTVKSAPATGRNLGWTEASDPDANVRVASKGNAALAEEIGARIRETRIRLGWTQAEFVRHTGVQDRYLRRWEAGENVPAVPALIQIARGCEVSIDWLVTGRDGPDETPAAFFDWAEGKPIEEKVKRFLRGLPTHGRRVDGRFYDRALELYEENRTRTRDEIISMLHTPSPREPQGDKPDGNP